MLIQNMTLDEFVAHYSLRIYRLQTLQLGLLLARGMPLEQAGKYVWGNNDQELMGSMSELERLGFIKPRASEVN